MLKFFRTFRSNFSTGKKSNNYFLYGIGEVLLIVFGILIALQIDNWNEYQKDRTFEKSILKDIQNSLKEDVIQLKGSEQRAGRMLGAIKQLLTLPEYQDSLNLEFMYALWYGLTFEPRTSAFENLRNEGFHVISDVQLRKSLINHFDYDYRRQVDLWEKEINRDREYRLDFVRQNFNFEEPNGKSRIIPKNYEHLVTSTEFRNILMERKSLVERVRTARINVLIDKIEFLNQGIEKVLR